VPTPLTIVKREPFNAETGPGMLEPDLTPTEAFYVRCHFSLPQDPPRRLSVGGLVERPLELTLDDLRGLGGTTVVSTMECAGNGRTALAPLAAGEPWQTNAVATAQWTGVPLRAVLEKAGLRALAREILAAGVDRGQPDDAPAPLDYERGLPLDKALDPDTLLAWEMNGAPLPTEHGGPLRLVVPDWYGMASVKWLARLEAREEPFAGYYKAQRYVYDLADGSAAVPVSRMRVKSLVISPPDWAHVGLHPLTIRGRAWSGEAPIARVEVSTRGGEFWEEARLLGAPSAHAWTAWEYTWQPPAPGRHAIRVRATDAAGNRQPDLGAWNRHGYGSNGVRVHVLEVDG